MSVRKIDQPYNIKVMVVKSLICRKFLASLLLFVFHRISETLAGHACKESDSSHPHLPCRSFTFLYLSLPLLAEIVLQTFDVVANHPVWRRLILLQSRFSCRQRWRRVDIHSAHTISAVMLREAFVGAGQSYKGRCIRVN